MVLDRVHLCRVLDLLREGRQTEVTYQRVHLLNRFRQPAASRMISQGLVGGRQYQADREHPVDGHLDEFEQLGARVRHGPAGPAPAPVFVAHGDYLTRRPGSGSGRLESLGRMTAGIERYAPFKPLKDLRHRDAAVHGTAFPLGLSTFV
jgi:hypothetical protein